MKSHGDSAWARQKVLQWSAHCESKDLGVHSRWERQGINKVCYGDWGRLAKMNQRAKCLGIRAAIEDFTFNLQASWALLSTHASFILYLIV